MEETESGGLPPQYLRASVDSSNLELSDKMIKASETRLKKLVRRLNEMEGTEAPNSVEDAGEALRLAYETQTSMTALKCFLVLCRSKLRSACLGAPESASSTRLLRARIRDIEEMIETLKDVSFCANEQSRLLRSIFEFQTERESIENVEG